MVGAYVLLAWICVWYFFHVIWFSIIREKNSYKINLLLKNIFGRNFKNFSFLFSIVFEVILLLVSFFLFLIFKNISCFNDLFDNWSFRWLWIFIILGQIIFSLSFFSFLFLMKKDEFSKNKKNKKQNYKNVNKYNVVWINWQTGLINYIKFFNRFITLFLFLNSFWFLKIDNVYLLVLMDIVIIFVIEISLWDGENDFISQFFKTLINSIIYYIGFILFFNFVIELITFLIIRILINIFLKFIVNLYIKNENKSSKFNSLNCY